MTSFRLKKKPSKIMEGTDTIYIIPSSFVNNDDIYNEGICGYRVH